MTEARIKDLMDKGYITQVVNPTELAKLTEAQLIEKGYITQVGIFDGTDSTTEEVPAEVTPTVVSNDDDLTPVAPVANDEPVADPEDEPVADPDDAPVVDEDEPEVEPVEE
jgi:hypothetical protein